MIMITAGMEDGVLMESIERIEITMLRRRGHFFQLALIVI